MRVLAGGGASAVPADGAIHPVPGQLGHQPAGIMTGVLGASLDWDRLGAAVMAASIAQNLHAPVGVGVKDRALRPSRRKPGPS